ncbi:MAG: DNA translocase FtsK 4TM domain-containing protein [Alistipes sp.]|nr:DNA translocase FtsK 4TM domain-containing protein [Alistipes sp.]
MANGQWLIALKRYMAKDKTMSRAEQKRKEREAKRKKSLTESDGTRTPWETICWIGGLLILLFSLYVLVAAVAHLFVWRNDLGALSPNPLNNVITFQNVCGDTGAKIADALIGRSFGVFGVLIPIIGMLFGGFLLLERSRVLWRTALSIMLVTICGSLTLASITKADGYFGSGWGGEFGIAIFDLLEGEIGVMGVVFVLVACWIVTGIIINLHFIDFLKRTTETSVEQGRDLLTSLKEYAARKREERVKRKEIQRLKDEAAAAEDSVRYVGKTTEENTTPAEEVGEPKEETTPEIEDVAIVIEESPNPQPTTSTPNEEVAEQTPKSNIDVVEVYEHKDAKLSAAQIDKHRPYNPDSTPDYKFPKVDFLCNYESGAEVSNDEIEQNKQRIEETLGNFGVPIISMTATIGPTVTLYEIVQEPGVKIARVQGLEKDIAQSLKALGIRIIAPIPGKGTIGIEVPNRNKETVSMRSAIQSERFQNYKAELPVVIGRTIQNENFVFDLAKMPHLLVAGATGQGKSVGLNAIIASLLYRKDPSQLKFVLIDPKTVEFSLYAKLEKHFLAKMESEEEAIVKDPKKAVYTLNSLCIEMENRLAKCGKVGVRNIVEYNDMVRQRKVEDDIMPYIVVVIDEFADLIMTAKEVEQPVMRLAQKARAIGIHLIVATQRPDVKVITGGIKANFPARIAFRVMQMIDSRTIIDQPGANQLIGRGDMLMSNGGELTRIQCAFVDTPEVRDIVEHISEQPFPYPSGTYLLPDYEDSNSSGGSDANFGSESGAPRQFDEHFAEVARDAVASGRFSTSYIQSVYGVGFNRAGRITRQLEQAGIIGPANGSKPRDVKIYDLQSLEALLQELGISE